MGCTDALTRRRLPSGECSAPPATQQPLEVLAGRGEQCLAVHLLQAAQAEAPQPMPVLRLREERLDPHPALAQRLLIRGGPDVAADPVEVVLVELAPDRPAALAVGAVGLAGAGVADRGRRLVQDDPLGVDRLAAQQGRAL